MIQLRWLAVRRSLLFAPLLVACSASLGCRVNGAATADLVAGVVSGDLPLDSLFRLQRSVALDENRDHFVGALADVTVDAGGRYYVADPVERDVKVFSPDGAFLRRLGRGVGKGPGELLMPVAVRMSPFDGRLAVTDVGNRRVLLFDARADTAVAMMSVVGGSPSVRLALPARGDTVVVAGVVLDSRAKEPYDAVLVAAGERLKGLLLRPEQYRDNRYAATFLHAVADQTRGFIFLALNADPTIRRFPRVGADTVERVALPPSVLPSVQLPQRAVRSFEELRAYPSTQRWLNGLSAVDDSTLVVDIISYDAPSGDWKHHVVLLDWDGENPRVWVVSPCDCKPVAHAGDTLLFARGGPPGVYRLEWRLLRRPGV